MNDPSRRVLNYLKTVGGRARVQRVVEATGLDRATILRYAGRAVARSRPSLGPARHDEDLLIQRIWQ